MRILIPVFFRAPMGGLQEHVRHHVRAAMAAGHHPVVACRPGVFAEQLRTAGAQVMTTEFDDPARDIDLALDSGPYHLVHTHPFLSRKLGLAVAQLTDTPLLITFHRIYHDSVSHYHDQVAAVIAVCPAIRDYLLDHTPLDAAKVVVIPNGTDLSRFAPSQPRQPSWAARPTVLFVGRLDEDKQRAIDAMVDAWEHQARGIGAEFRWIVAGEGNLRTELSAKAKSLTKHNARAAEVEFTGWVDQDRLAHLYREAAVCLGPGRCALDAMAAGTPAIAAGYRDYLGPIHGTTTLSALHGNFGESAGDPDAYKAGQLTRDLQWLTEDRGRWQSVSSASNAWAAAFLDQRAQDQLLLSLYEQVAKTEATAVHLSPPRRVEAWHYWDAQGKLADHYQCPHKALLSRPVDAPDSLHVAADREVTFYLSSSGGAFSKPSSDTERWGIRADCLYRLQADVVIATPTAAIELWVIEYDGKKRLKHTRWRSEQVQGGNAGHLRAQLTWRSHSDTHSLRIGIRFAGSGQATVGPLYLARYSE